MANKKTQDYSIFTKQELIDFLTKYDSYCWHIHNPFDIMIDEKMDAVMKKISEINNSQQGLSTEFKSFEQQLKWVMEIEKNHKKWIKLNKEYDRLSKLRFADD